MIKKPPVAVKVIILFLILSLLSALQVGIQELFELNKVATMLRLLDIFLRLGGAVLSVILVSMLWRMKRLAVNLTIIVAVDGILLRSLIFFSQNVALPHISAFYNIIGSAFLAVIALYIYSKRKLFTK